MKICTKCGEIKEDSCFAKDSRRKDKMTVWCKECRNAVNKVWRDENRDIIAKTNIAYREYRKEYYNREDIKLKYRKSFINRTHGIDYDEYERLLEQQGGVCVQYVVDRRQVVKTNT